MIYIEDLQDLDDRDGWKESKHGNLWRTWAGLTLTLFRRDGGWLWCVAGRKGPRYSKTAFGTRREAKDALKGWLVKWQD
jgi:hypothetical protein